MAKIQNPQNERGELLATEKNVSNSLQSLSEQLTNLKYIVSNITNEVLPAEFELDINVATDLANATTNQLADALAAKDYTDEETARAKGREDAIENSLNAEITRATTAESAIESSLTSHTGDTIKHVSEEERLTLANSIKVDFNTNKYLNDGSKSLITQAGTSGFQVPYQMLPTGRILKVNIDNDKTNPGSYKLQVIVVKTDGTIVDFLSDNNDYKSWTFENSKLIIDDTVSYIKCRPGASNTFFNIKKYAIDLGNGAGVGGAAYPTEPSTSILNETGLKCLPVVNFEVYGPSFKEYINSVENQTNINNFYDKANNVTKVTNGVISIGGTTVKFNPENILSAEYAFRTTNGGESNPLAYSQLTSFNERTIHTSLDGTTTNNTSDPIEIGKTNRTQSYSVEYEQDLLWKDDENYETLGNLINGTGMFMRNKIQVFNDDLTCLTTAKGMFGTNRELTDFKSPLPSLVNAKSMFTGCRALTNWRVKLPSLVIGANMFSDLSELMELSSVDTCLPNLTMARQMFAGCKKLIEFHVPSTSFSNLYDAREMFYACPLTSINGNFESLEDGTNMLPNAHLDLASIQNIAETIRDWSNGYPAGTNEDGSPKTITPTISLGIGLNDVEGDDNVIAIKAELDKIRERGWNVLVSWNGPSGVSTANETNKTFFTRIYDSGAFNTHIDENGKPCSIITTDSLKWISDKDSWSPMVSSLEEAEAYFKLTKIEKVEESTEEII